MGSGSMLSGSNDEKLAIKKVDSKVVPLYQVWQELVHVQTLDVYQYRVLIEKIKKAFLRQMYFLQVSFP